MLEMILGTMVVVVILNVLVLFRVYKQKVNQAGIMNELENFKFHQQNQNMLSQKALTNDLAQLREGIVMHVSRSNDQTIKELLEFQNKLTNELYKNFERLSETIHLSLDKISDKVDLRLSEGFQRTNQTFANIVERLGKIDEAQRKIEGLSTDIISLQEVLSDKKSRGTFGEVQLTQILSSSFGERNDKVYELQKTLSNRRVVDAILHTPKPLGSIAIDSKFPLENYQKMTSGKADEFATAQAKKLFKQDVKNHIQAIKDRYILPNETADSAIMFIPAEAVFAEINAYHQDLIEYAQKHRVWIASPTTLMFLLATVQVIIRNIERDKYSAIIQEELNKLGEEFRRYKLRWDKLSRNIDQVSQNVKELHTTSDKIERHFDSISRVELDEIEGKNRMINKENER